MLQKRKRMFNDEFSNSYYKIVRKHLLLLGLEPYHKDINSYILMIISQITLGTMIISTVRNTYKANIYININEVK